jgi:hypothetical protein
MKRYRVFDYLCFLFVAFAYQTVMRTCCPRCMRKSLLLRTFLNLPLANILWPLVLIGHGIAFLATFTNGHSKSILQLLNAR